MISIERDSVIEEILKNICVDIIYNREKISQESNIGVLTGTSGISLFLFNMYRFSSNSVHKENAWYFLEKTLEKVNQKEFITPICTGLAGACWTINHLIENSYIDKDNTYVLDSLDEFLFHSMREQINIGLFDYFHGASGIAYYFLSRINKNVKAKEYIQYFNNSIMKAVKYNAENTYCKLILFDGIRKKYDLGMAHGLSSIIIILTKILEIDNENSELRKIIIYLLNYFEIIEIKSKDRYKQLFPAIEKFGEYNQAESDRIGWCYGDLGVGLAFLYAYRVTKISKYLQKASAIFHHSNLIRDIEKQGIKDVCMCHGTMGIANMYRYLVDNYDANNFDDTQNYWFDKTVDYYIRSGLQGFSMYQNKKYVYSRSVLEGTSGLGLSFLSYLRKKEISSWDEIFLLC